MRYEKRRKTLRLTLMCVLLLTLMLCVADAAIAEEVALEDKKGIEGLFAGKMGGDEVDPRSPNAAQKWLGIGSFAVTFIVFKYL